MPGAAPNQLNGPRSIVAGSKRIQMTQPEVCRARAVLIFWREVLAPKALDLSYTCRTTPLADSTTS